MDSSPVGFGQFGKWIGGRFRFGWTERTARFIEPSVTRDVGRNYSKLRESEREHTWFNHSQLGQP
jgi:hypothetical protein